MASLKKIFPWRVRLFIGAVVLCAGALAAYAARSAAPLELPEWAAILVFGLLAATSHFRPTWSQNQQSKYNLLPAAYFAMAMVLPPPAIPLVIIASWVPWSVMKLRRFQPTFLVEVSFNLSLDIIVAVASRFVFLLGSAVVPSPALALLVSAVTFVALQTALVATIVVLYRRIPYREVDTLKMGSISTELSTVIVGGITALLFKLDPMSLVMIFLPFGYLQYVMEKVKNQQAAFLDAKTGVYNYRYLDERLPKEIERARNTGVPLSVIFSDLDFLREINNNHGHLAGDLAIQHVASVLKNCLQDNQFAARFGGEEFVMVLPQVDHAGALRIAELARARVAESTIHSGETQFRVTMSFGVATVPDDALNVRDLIHTADLAVYQAKASGRNCVCSYRKEVKEACAASQ
ncbi:MAG TPA: diguanylate cyclase [Symbiobacteriaceae bacterium]|nr:diguanylate cyclase [Symbiobacteriaceae bacterium]